MRRLLTLAAAAGLLLPAGIVRADTFDAARAAFHHGNTVALARLAPALERQPLGIYVDYWRLMINLEHQDPAAVAAFLAAHPGTLLEQRLRAQWLKKLAQNGDWAAYAKWRPGLETPDAELACLDIEARVPHDDPGAVRDALTEWRQGFDVSPGCLSLFDSLSRQTLTGPLVWARVGRMLDGGDYAAAQTLIRRYLPAPAAAGFRRLDAARGNPVAFLDRLQQNWWQDRALRETVLVALVTRYGTDPVDAFRRWQAMSGHFSDTEQSRMWARLGTLAAQNQDPAGLDWFARAQGPWLDSQLAWMARLALRQGQWPQVETAIRRMSPQQQALPEWRYWLGRCLLARGERDAAQALFAHLAGLDGFYEQLAASEIGQPAHLPATTPVPAAALRAFGRDPQTQLIVALRAHGLAGEAMRQWLFMLRHADDPKCLAAAAFAEQHDWYDLEIQAADATFLLHDVARSYPMPYGTDIRDAAAHHHLDPAWVFGLIRQESRFMDDARSGVQARGLMQLMPATERWIAGKVGLHTPFSRFSADLNIRAGVWYLDYIMAHAGDPVLATAAYNAGLSHARHWQAATPMEAAVYIASIPYVETREYVEKVMANATWYALRLGQSPDGLKQRLGHLPARPAD